MVLAFIIAIIAILITMNPFGGSGGSDEPAPSNNVCSDLCGDIDGQDYGTCEQGLACVNNRCANPQCPENQDCQCQAEQPAACSDGQDNDGDELVDAEDPGCISVDFQGNQNYDPDDNDEFNQVQTTPQCSDGQDNDGDGFIDADDPGCIVDDGQGQGIYDPERDDEVNANQPSGICGDGEVQVPNSEGVNEVCDDGNVSDFDQCSSTCQASCPEGLVWNSKECIDPQSTSTTTSTNTMTSTTSSGGTDELPATSLEPDDVRVLAIAFGSFFVGFFLYRFNKYGVEKLEILLNGYASKDSFESKSEKALERKLTRKRRKRN